MAVLLPDEYVTDAGTRAFEGSRNSIVLVLIVAGSIASLNVAVMFCPTLAPVAPSAGEVEVIVGGVESVTLVLKTTSTQ